MSVLAQFNLNRDEFDGRVAVVTGAARGLGEYVARGLAQLGAHSILLDILPEGKAVAEELTHKGLSAEFHRLDLRDAVALDTFQAEILDTHGCVDILVNNAATLSGAPFVETPMEVWDDLYRTTVRASAYLISRFLPAMQANRFGIIANTIAAEGLSYAAYFSSAMVGQRSIVLSLAGETKRGDGVSAFAFAPGVMDTELVHNDDKTLQYYGMTEEEWVRDFVHNPG